MCALHATRRVPAARMAPKSRRQRFTQPRWRTTAPSAANAPAPEASDGQELPPPGSLTETGRLDEHLSPAVQRRRFYAVLAWQNNYSETLRLEASTNEPFVEELPGISQYARSIIRRLHWK